MNAPINRDQFIQAAWDWCWNERVRPAEEPWLCALTVQRRCRAAAVEMLRGLPPGELGSDAYWSGVRVTGCPDLQDVRRWLYGRVAAGVLRVDNPRGRTSTSARFRPVAVPLTAAEQKAAALPKKEKMRRNHIRHYAIAPSMPPGNVRTRRLCQPGKPLGGVFRRHGWMEPTTDAARVTCKRCLALLAAKTGLTKDTPAPIIADKLQEITT